MKMIRIRSCSLLLIIIILAQKVHCQEGQTLPPPCPLGGKYTPGVTQMPNFVVTLTNGSQWAYNSSSRLLPIVVMALDESDWGMRLMIEDDVSVDTFLLADGGAPPSHGTFLVFGMQEGTSARLESKIMSRMDALNLPASAQKGWKDRFAFAAQTPKNTDDVRYVLEDWPSPFITLLNNNTTRLDGANECYSAVFATETDTVWPTILSGCSQNVTNSSEMEGAFLLVDVPQECTPVSAVAWTQNLAPQAKGVILGVDGPSMLGRNCTDVFYTDPFIPSMTSHEALRNIAASALSSEVSPSVLFNYTCRVGNGFVVDELGVVQHLGWRKVNSLMLYRWERGMTDYLASVEATVKQATRVVTLLPPLTPINPIGTSIVTIPAEMISQGKGAMLDFTLRCPHVDDASCGPWDRIISGTAQCSSNTSSSALVEISRWITPFRRGVGRWLTSADSFLSLAATNGSSCVVSVSVCCEMWLGGLNLVLFHNGTRNLSPSPSSRSLVPFQTTLVVFPNNATVFDTHYNENRTAYIVTPPGVSRVQLRALISGHGSDPPPPVGSGCEYAPTSHAWDINGRGTFTKYNTTLSSSSQQYVEAGTPTGCIHKVPFGVIANQHGDYPDGRDGWCPGWVVDPVILDITSDWSTEGGSVNTVTYRALSYYVGNPTNGWVPTHPSPDGCGGYIVMSTMVLFT